MKASFEDLKEVRERAEVGLADAKRALETCNDVEGAVALLLREKAQSKFFLQSNDQVDLNEIGNTIVAAIRTAEDLSNLRILWRNDLLTPLAKLAPGEDVDALVGKIDACIEANHPEFERFAVAPFVEWFFLGFVDTRLQLFRELNVPRDVDEQALTNLGKSASGIEKLHLNGDTIPHLLNVQLESLKRMSIETVRYPIADVVDAPWWGSLTALRINSGMNTRAPEWLQPLFPKLQSLRELEISMGNFPRGIDLEHAEIESLEFGYSYVESISHATKRLSYVRFRSSLMGQNAVDALSGTDIEFVDCGEISDDILTPAPNIVDSWVDYHVELDPQPIRIK